MALHVLTGRDFIRLQSMLRWFERNHNLRNPMRRRSINGGGGGANGQNQLAKTQEGGQVNGRISVKLLDALGSEIGDAFDVYAFADKASNNMTSYKPELAAADTIIVTQGADQNWYMIWPTLIEFINVSVITDWQVSGVTLQKKTRTLSVLETSAESAWTTVHTGTACP